MRKIYSLVLMTAMLFVGTNLWATSVDTVKTIGDFKTKWSQAQNGNKIVLGANMTAEDIYWLGTDSMAYAMTVEQPLSLTVDLNGYTLTASTLNYLFVISHGTLHLESSRPGGKLLQQSTGGSELIYMSGSTLKDCDPSQANSASNPYFSHLIIDADVTVDASLRKTALVIDYPTSTSGVKAGGYKNGQVQSGKATYTTRIYKDKANVLRDLANGVRIDIYGTILGEKYGIKVNGYIRGPREFFKKNDDGTIKEPLELIAGNPQTRPNAQIGKTTGTYYHPTTASEPYPTTAYPIDTLDTRYTPYVHLHTGSQVIASADGYMDGSKLESSPAIYCSGYARWLIEGSCSGSVGVIVKSGDVAVNNATITSTWEGEYGGAAATTSGSTSQGSAIVVQSADGWTGDVSMTISGTSEISSTTGYALEETVTANVEGSKVETITISGGTFEGGSQGAIAVSTKGEDDKYVTQVVSGNIEGQIQDLAEGETKTIGDIINPTNSHTTTVTDGETTTVVVSQGAEPESDANVAGHDENSSVKWTGPSEDIEADLTLKELEINESTAQTLTIKTGKTLSVGRVVLGPLAQIIVEPGARFLVTGDDGIYSQKPENIILQSNATAQATFIIAPKVKSNRQPNATIELTTVGRVDGAGNTIWQRFATPVLKTTAPTKSISVGTAVKYLDFETESWVTVTNWNQLRIFAAASIASNTTSTGVKYTFTGKLAGNVVDSIKLHNVKWNYYGNSFMAPMSIRHLSDTLQTQGVDATVYVWNVEHQKYDLINRKAYLFEEDDYPLVDSIYSMEFFVINNSSRKEGVLDINYAKTVYDYAINPTNHRDNPSAAPMRQNAENLFRISVESYDGMDNDKVYVIESSEYSSAYENGSDAEKLMKEGLNLYVADELDLAMLATDDVIGTQLTLQTVEDVNYTFTFSKVRGEHYALRDNMTGRVVEIVEGGQYTFSAQPNEQIEGRFEIVGRQEMPTAVETIEETVAPKAIYTVMGQYVGETTDWNNLPAGVYVVDGVKVVK